MLFCLAAPLAAVTGTAMAEESLPIPKGATPAPVEVPHFPRRADAFIFRNWGVVPVERIAEALGTGVNRVRDVGRELGLGEAPPVPADQLRRSALTIIRRNWHLVPYPQLLRLLDWSEGKLGYALREDDFLWVKLGSLKPACETLRLDAPLQGAPGDAVLARHAEIRAVVAEALRASEPRTSERPFQFLETLAGAEADPPAPSVLPQGKPRFALRFLHSYFALYGDALVEPGLDPYPAPYLSRLERSGVNGVWLPVLLRNMAPAGEALGLESGERGAHDREERLENLRRLVERAKSRGVGVYIYLNEPRAMPLELFEGREGLRGVTEGDSASLCTSVPEVRRFLVESVRHICARVPDLGGFFTITASENLTSCWSHHRGKECPRCASRPPAEVVADVNRAVLEGVRAAGSKARVIAWDWGWPDDWIEPAIAALPAGASVMSVSEWSLPIERGGVKSEVGEYSLSAVGPGPRAERAWRLAKARGLEAIAKVQANNSWELSAVPYIPVVKLAAEHARKLAERGVDGVMLGWTLGGYPSPNLEAFARYALPDGGSLPAVDEVLRDIAVRRFGPESAGTVVKAWDRMSEAFRDYPYHGALVYRAPVQLGPANLLHTRRTGYSATMVGFPYDDLDGWRAVYPPEVYAGLFEKVAGGFAEGMKLLREARVDSPALEAERRVADASRLHFLSVALQARFVLARDAFESDLARGARDSARTRLDEIERIARAEEAAAMDLLGIARADSRIGFEASNQYYYLPIDLVEKVVSTRWIRTQWIPDQRRRT